MNRIRNRVMGSMMIASFFCMESLLVATSALATTPSGQPILVSDRVLPAVTSYDCDTAGAITLIQEGSASDRFTYEAVNSRGTMRTIRNGVGYGDQTSVIYTFVAPDDSRVIIEEMPDGKATLNTYMGKDDANPATFACTVSRSTRSSNGSNPGSTPVRALW